ncbi:MAG: hypothetical protein NZ895_00480 [Archaeoglobaceae archaeon]|nr:hypothetical protein [Archaeoglobaceae archaeon]MCX8151894.1 hypothetical protein [Archaeoglobaceae archaeon]MDW8013283.1 hypothetical protein [Archaeoglobaceae archaeon]
MGSEVYYFTFTGNSKMIAEKIASRFSLKISQIKAPKLPYLAWLILSFTPFEVKSSFKEVEEEDLILCFPKWTFNCPPVTYFLKRLKARKLAMVISYGGFDEVRYAEFYRSLAMKRVEACSYFLMKRGKFDERVFDWLKDFLHI